MFKVNLVNFIPAALVPYGSPFQFDGNNHGLGVTDIFDEPSQYKTNQQVYVMTGSPGGQVTLD